jgi:sulfoxide reductase catalytic subunit YedY
VPERETSSRLIVSSYNNYYEFKHQGDLKEVWPLTGAYEPFPMTISVGGLVENEQTLDVAQLMRSMDLEERLYRFRCVEAWSLTVPWTGFPLRDLIARCQPLSRATHVRFFSVNRPDQMPAATGGWYEFPYYEGLRMDEATHTLAFVATGVYGEPLPKQNGSPLRLVLPWKYGYKNAKAIDRIEFVDREPPTFWNDEAPSEYGFLSNVNPNVPHPRWSQATEEFLVDEDTKREVDTQIFNGYDEWVADLYPDEPRSPTEPMAR